MAGTEITPAHDLAEMPEEMAAEVRIASEARRKFMQASGLAALGAVAAGCTWKDVHVTPLQQKPEDITPGLTYWYASTCEGCSANCGTMMKVRDGRPIKAEGNKVHPVSHGGLCAIGQATVMSLYDSIRLKGPSVDGSDLKWAELDARVTTALGAAATGIRILSGTVNSPTTLAQIEAFKAKYPGTKHVSYDAVSSRAILDAHAATHGTPILPRYRFDQAEVIVSFGADFLGTWISPVEFAKGWAARRHLADGTDHKAARMSRHYQIEAGMSLTGANADERIRIKDSQRGAVLVALAARLGGASNPFSAGDTAVPAKMLDRIASDLKAARGKSLVVSDSADVEQQKIVNFINHALGNYGATLDLQRHSLQKLGNDADVATLLTEMEAGQVKVLIFYGVNPVYDLPDAARFEAAMAKVGTRISLNLTRDETTALCKILAPDHHGLEAWNDHEAQRGIFSLVQPTINPIYKTRAAQTSLRIWAGVANAAMPYRQVVEENWKRRLTPPPPAKFGEIEWRKRWARLIEVGVDEWRATPREYPFRSASVSAQTGRIAARDQKGKGFEVVTYQSVAMGDGRHANNAWLQEVPDPVSKVTWDNYLLLSLAEFKKLGLAEGDLLKLDAKVGRRKVSLTLPAIAQPGQADGTIAIALGYGRTGEAVTLHTRPNPSPMFNEADFGENAKGIGRNAFPLLEGGEVVFATIAATGENYQLALTQTHDSQEERPILKQSTFKKYLKKGNAGNDQDLGDIDVSMWPKWKHEGHRWGMVVNLNSCIGCAGCVVSCNAENNIPVVGKDEVFRRREMHWMRIDRYYSDPDPANGDNTTDDNPETGFQPMFCQHCENAPCETVCPVGATVHSAEGLNAQAYNRCIGTRYCANNCPYKVRRFNWFTYPHDDPTENLVLNPDVTIRTRGVMEKCTMCVQRISDSKREASKQGRKPRPEEMNTACQQSCPTNALVFGDLNDKKSPIYKLTQDPRNYSVLAELNTRPGVTYLTKIRNKASE